MLNNTVSAFKAAIRTVRPRRAALHASACTLVALLPIAAGAADHSWTGATDSSFSNAANWSPASVPGAADSVFIQNIATNTPALTGGTTTIDGLQIGSIAGSEGALTISGGAALDVTQTITLAAHSSLFLSGAGTELISHHQLYAYSGSGAGDLTITNHAMLYVTGSYYSQFGTGGARNLYLSNGATLKFDGDFDTNGTQIEATDSTITTGGRFGLASSQVTLTNTDISADRIVAYGTGAALNLGAADGSAPGGVGSFDVNRFALYGPAEFVINHSAENYEIGTAIYGDGTIRHLAGDTILSGDGEYFSGATKVEGGSLRVTGTLGDGTNSVTVYDGATLGGSGTVNGYTVFNAGSTLAPDGTPATGGTGPIPPPETKIPRPQRIGTLTLGNFTFASGATYNVELNSGGNVAGVNNDLTNVIGTAALLGGDVWVTGADTSDDGSTYTPGLTYTIVTTGSGVQGTFDGVSDDFAYLDFILTYDSNNVYLTSALVGTLKSFCLPGYTFNECHTANGVFSLGSGKVFNAIAGQTTAAAPWALDQLSGEIYGSARATLISEGFFTREAALGRLDPLRTAGYSQRYLGEGTAYWGQLFHATTGWASDGNAGATNRSVTGFFVGADHLFTDNLRVGVFAGAATASFSTPSRGSTGTSTSRYVGMYAGGSFGMLDVRGGAAYGVHDISISRDATFTGFSDQLSASFQGHSVQVFGEAGLRIAVAPAVTIEPYFGLAHMHLVTDAYRESGGVAALSGYGRTMDTTFATAGLRMMTETEWDGMPVRFSASAAVRHAFGDVNTFTTHAFAGGNDFVVKGVPIAGNVLELGTGFEIDLAPDTTLSLAYQGQFGSGLRQHTVSVGLTIRF